MGRSQNMGGELRCITAFRVTSQSMLTALFYFTIIQLTVEIRKYYLPQIGAWV